MLEHAAIQQKKIRQSRIKKCLLKGRKLKLIFKQSLKIHQ